MKVLKDRSAWWAPESTTFDVLTPYRADRDATRPLDPLTAVEDVVAPLVGAGEQPLAAANAGGKQRRIVIVDGSLALDEDVPAWRHPSGTTGTLRVLHLVVGR